MLSGRRASLRAGIAVLYDYTFFAQDSASVSQVGRQQNTADLRAGRLILLGQLKFRRPWTYFVSLDYNEHHGDDDRSFDVLDLNLRIPLWGTTSVTIGKGKEPFVFEMSSVAATLPQQERILSPFFINRNVGVRLSGTARRGRLTWSAGWFNDWLDKGQSFGAAATDFVARVTTLPVLSRDGARYLHLAVSARYRTDQAGMLRLKGRPESNVASYYVDTGDFAGKSVTALGFEALWNRGPLVVAGELTPALTDAPSVGNPTFFGWNVVAGYVLTGEHRPYNRTFGYTGSIVPRRRIGAWEVVARYSRVDLTDASVSGGDMSKWYLGLNWWATPQWKFGAGIGPANLTNGGIRGHTTLALLRSQWTW